MYITLKYFKIVYFMEYSNALKKKSTYVYMSSDELVNRMWYTSEGLRL